MSDEKGKKSKRERSNKRANESEEYYEWVPRTKLGKKVMEGQYSSIDEIIDAGEKIKEPEIVDKLIPDIKSEIIYIGGSPGKGGGSRKTPTRRTARMHRSGRRFKISSMVVVGDGNGHVGVGFSEGVDNRDAIEKATRLAKINIFRIERGCGSLECMCGQPHSIPMKTEGKSGSVRVVLIPAPKGIGLCASEEAKKFLKLAGVKDIWFKSFGNTGSRINFIYAIENAFKNLNKRKVGE